VAKCTRTKSGWQAHVWTCLGKA